MSAPGTGILLALSGDDADILRTLSQPGSGLCVVRRCADLPELLSAGMAGLASFALLDTGFDEIDRTVLDRLARAGLSGLLLVEGHEEERWSSAGWPVLRRDAAPGSICSAMQGIARRGANCTRGGRRRSTWGRYRSGSCGRRLAERRHARVGGRGQCRQRCQRC